MKRQEFLRWTGLGLLTLWLDPMTLFQSLAAAGTGSEALVLIELQGGNDGLNTLVPFASPAYYQLRPRLALGREQVLQLSPELGMHPALAPLLPLWKRNQLAWVLGVGYPQPNRSHFRSIEIWESGSRADEYLDSGWLAQVLPQLSAQRRSLADGVVLGLDTAGPLAGTQLRTVTLNPGGHLPKSARSQLTATGGPAALQHILGVSQSLEQAGKALEQRLAQAPPLTTPFPNTPIGRQLKQVATLIRAGVPSPVYKLTHGGFDTHRQQLGTHARLLTDLAEALAAFEAALAPDGHWNRTLVMSYSEFGRRAGENASGGTDHGTAAPQLILGGRVKGGFYGRQPALDNLSEGDLRHGTDFRSLYQTIARRWWGVQSPWSEVDHSVLGFV